MAGNPEVQLGVHSGYGRPCAGLGIGRGCGLCGAQLQQLTVTHHAQLYYIVLTAENETIRQRIALRGDVELTERALFLKDKLDHMAENQGHLYDNTDKTVEQMLAELEIEKFLLSAKMISGTPQVNGSETLRGYDMHKEGC